MARSLTMLVLVMALFAAALAGVRLTAAAPSSSLIVRQAPVVPEAPLDRQADATLAPGVEAASPVQAVPGVAVREAFDLLMDRSVFAPSSGMLLTAAWDGANGWFRRQQLAVPTVDGPRFGGAREQDWSALAAAYSELLERGQPNITELDQAMVRAMAITIDDPHTGYLAPDSLRQNQAAQRGDYGRTGLGLRISSDLTVVDVYEGSPAFAAGIVRGDQLAAIDGTVTTALSNARIAATLAAPADQPVRLTVARAGSRRQETFDLISSAYAAPWITATMLEDGIGYLKIRRFEFFGRDGAGQAAFDAAMQSLAAPGLRALVVDVRDNGGGAVSTGNLLLGRLADCKTIYQLADRGSDPRLVQGRARGPALPAVPTVVLVNRSSASMAEISAAALQESRGAVVIGTRTRGAVATATTHGLSDGSGLAITVARVLSPSGRELNRVGLEPDRTIEFSLPELRDGQDTQLRAGLAELRRALAPLAAELEPAA